MSWSAKLGWLLLGGIVVMFALFYRAYGPLPTVCFLLVSLNVLALLLFGHLRTVVRTAVAFAVAEMKAELRNQSVLRSLDRQSGRGLR